MIDINQSTLEIVTSTATTADIRVTVRDAEGAPVLNAQVRLQVSPPDVSDTITYPTTNNIGYTDTSGQVDITFSSAVTGQRTFSALLGEDDGLINGHRRPRLTDVVCDITFGNTIVGGTLSSPQTYSDTLFDGPVTVAGSGFVFNSCTFDAQGGAFAVTLSANNVFNNCRFVDAAGDLVRGKGGTFNRCLFSGADGNGAALVQDSSDTVTTNQFIECIFNDLANYGVMAGPVQNLTIYRCWFDLPHDSAPAYNGGRSNTGSLLVLTSGPSANLDINTNWFYGGVITVAFADGGGVLSNASFHSNRLGDATSYSAGGSPTFSSSFPLLSSGNVFDASGRLVLNSSWPHVNDTETATFFPPSVLLSGDDGGGTTTFDNSAEYDFDDPFANNGALGSDLTLTGQQITVVCDAANSGAITEISWAGEQLVNSKTKDRGVQNKLEITQGYAAFANVLEAGTPTEDFADPSSSRYIGSKTSRRQLLTNTFMAYDDPLLYKQVTLACSGNILAKEIFMDFLGNPNIVGLRTRVHQYASTKQGTVNWALDLHLSEVLEIVYLQDTAQELPPESLFTAGESGGIPLNFSGGVIAAKSDGSKAIGIWHTPDSGRSYNVEVAVPAAQEGGDPKFTSTTTRLAFYERITEDKTGRSEGLHHQFRYLCVGTLTEVEAAFNQLQTAFDVPDTVGDEDLIVTDWPSQVDILSTFAVTVAAIDGAGNVRTDYNETVQVRDTLNDDELTGMKSLQFSSGLATFADLQFTHNGLRQLRFDSDVYSVTAPITSQNPYPVFDSFTTVPAVIDNSVNSFSVLITGSDFQEGVVGLISDVNTETVFHSSTSIELVQSTPLYPGNHPIKVLNDSPGGGFSEERLLAVADVLPPVISGLQVTETTDDSATITWTTDEEATSDLMYTGPVSGSVVNIVPTMSHTAVVTGLTAGEYSFVVEVTDTSPAFNAFTSGEVGFTIGDIVAPVIENVVVDEITASGARISWYTEEPSNSDLSWTSDNVNIFSSSDLGSFVQNHVLYASGLTAATLYRYTITSADAAGNSDTLIDTFQTNTDTGNPPTFVQEPTVVSVTDTSVTLTWLMSESVPCFVSIGTSTGNYSRVDVAGNTVEFTYLVDSLGSGTQYFFTVHSHSDINDPQDFQSTEINVVTNNSSSTGSTQVVYGSTAVPSPLLQTVIPIDPTATLPTFYVDGNEADVFPVSWTGEDLMDTVQVVAPCNGSGNAVITSTGAVPKPAPNYNTLDMSTMKIVMDVAGKATDLEGSLIGTEVEVLRTGAFIDERHYFSRIEHPGHTLPAKDLACAGLHTFITRRSDSDAIDIYLVIANDVFDTSKDTSRGSNTHDEVAGEVYFKSISLTGIPVGWRLTTDFDDFSMYTPINTTSISVVLPVDKPAGGGAILEQILPSRGKIIRHYVMTSNSTPGVTAAVHVASMGDMGSARTGDNTYYAKPGFGGTRHYFPPMTVDFQYANLAGHAANTHRCQITYQAVRDGAELGIQDSKFKWFRNWGGDTENIGTTPAIMQYGWYQPYDHAQSRYPGGFLVHNSHGWQNDRNLWMTSVLQMMYGSQRNPTTLTDIDGSIVTATTAAAGNSASSGNNLKHPWMVAFRPSRPERWWPHFVHSATGADTSRVLAPTDRVWNAPDDVADVMYNDNGLDAIRNFSNGSDDFTKFGPYDGDHHVRFEQALVPLVWSCNLGVAKWLLQQEAAHLEHCLGHYPVENNFFPFENDSSAFHAKVHHFPTIIANYEGTSPQEWGRQNGNQQFDMQRGMGHMLHVIGSAFRTLAPTTSWRGELRGWADMFAQVYDLHVANTGLVGGGDGAQPITDGNAVNGLDFQFGTSDCANQAGTLPVGFSSHQAFMLSYAVRGIHALMESFWTLTHPETLRFQKTIVNLPFFLWQHADIIGNNYPQNFVIASATVNGSNDPPRDNVVGWDFTTGAGGGYAPSMPIKTMEMLTAAFAITGNQHFKDWGMRLLMEFFIGGSGLSGTDGFADSLPFPVTSVTEANLIFNKVAGVANAGNFGVETERTWATHAAPFVALINHKAVTNNDIPILPGSIYPGNDLECP